MEQVKIDMLKWHEPSGVIIFPKPGRGKSVIGKAIDKVVDSGWESLSDEEKEIVNEVVGNNPHFKKHVDKNR